MYERIFEINGQRNYKVYSCYLVNSVVAAKYTGDTFTGHPSQKPKQLLITILDKISKPGQLILDPFAGSGSLPICCEKINRKWIGIEISEEYCEIAAKRIDRETAQLKLW